MSYSLEFPYRHLYDSRNKITVPITLLSDSSRWVDVVAAVDSGSTFNIFDRVCAESLGLSIELGLRQQIGTAVGSFYCYGHELTVSVFDLEWQALVYFAEPEAFNINVVGRVGFLDRLHVGIVDYDRLLYLGPYDQE